MMNGAAIDGTKEASERRRVLAEQQREPEPESNLMTLADRRRSCWRQARLIAQMNVKPRPIQAPSRPIFASKLESVPSPSGCEEQQQMPSQQVKVWESAAMLRGIWCGWFQKACWGELISLSCGSQP